MIFFEICEFFVQCLSPLGALVPNVEMVWARARAEEAVASQTHRALFTFVAKSCLTPVLPGRDVSCSWYASISHTLVRVSRLQFVFAFPDLDTGVRQNFATNVKSARCVCEATASSARPLAHPISILVTSAPRGDSVRLENKSQLSLRKLKFAGAAG